MILVVFCACGAVRSVGGGGDEAGTYISRDATAGVDEEEEGGVDLAVAAAVMEEACYCCCCFHGRRSGRY